MNDTPTNEQDALFARVKHVATNVELFGLRLIGCQCGQSQNTIQGVALPENLHQTINIQSGRTADEPHGRIVVIVSFQLIASDAKPEPGKEMPLFLQASFLLAYNLTSAIETSNDDLTAFAQTNGMLNIWPYWRELVNTMTLRMGVPPLQLPLFRVGNTKFEPAEPIGQLILNKGTDAEKRPKKKSRAGKK